MSNSRKNRQERVTIRGTGTEGERTEAVVLGQLYRHRMQKENKLDRQAID